MPLREWPQTQELLRDKLSEAKMWGQPDLPTRFPTHPSPVVLLLFTAAFSVTQNLLVVLTMRHPPLDWLWSSVTLKRTFKSNVRTRMTWDTSRKAGTRRT